MSPTAPPQKPAFQVGRRKKLPLPVRACYGNPMSRTSLKITPIRTKLFKAGENLVEFIVQSAPADMWKEGLLLAITSKIVSLAENRLASHALTNKADLIQSEAEYVIGEMKYGTILTIKNGLLVASAGIDESNSQDGNYILLPKDAFKSAFDIHQKLKDRLNLKNLGIILIDSRTSPLRRGVVGVGISFAGFRPLANLVGKSDLFDRPLKMTQVNIVDSLAGAAALMMGESDESQPLAIIENAPVEFTSNSSRDDLIVAPAEDMYLPLYQHALK